MTFPSPPSPPGGDTAAGRPPSPPSPLWPEPVPEPPRRSTEGLLMGGAALLAALVVLGGLFLWNRTRPSDSDVVAEPASTSEAAAPGTTEAPEATEPTEGSPTTQPDGDQVTEGESPSTTEGPLDSDELTGNAPCPTGVPMQVCDAAAFVEDFRGRPFKDFPDVQLVDDEAFAERLLRDFEEASEELAITTEVWRSLGFIEPDVDLGEALATSLEIGVVGVYFTDTKELYVQGTDLNLYAELVIVHELVHAHDDQWLDLSRDEYEDAEDEIAYGFSAVVEGNARRVENAWRDQLSTEQKEELTALEFGVLSPEEIEIYLSLPQLLLEFQISPYQDGLDLVTAIAAEGGEEAVDAAIIDPPTTSEQVLHPALFSAEEPLVPVPPPEAEGEIIDEGLVGELAWDLWLGNAVGDGWGGDYYVTWETASGACTRINAIGDTEADSQEIFDAADAWSRQAQGRSVERVGDFVRLTGCY